MRLIKQVGVFVILIIVIFHKPSFTQTPDATNAPWPATWHWTGDGTAGESITRATNLALTPLQPPHTRVTYRRGGMLNQAVVVNGSNRGYLIQSNTAPYHGAFVWMAFVWTNGYSSSAQTILWNEGANPLGYYVAGFAIAILSDGRLAVSVGDGPSWKYRLSSRHHVGIQSWQHVALAWDTQKWMLYLNGFLEDSVASADPPEWATKLTLGSFYYGGAGRYILDGALDEVKLITLTATSVENVLQHEYGMAFRHRVLSDLATRFDPRIPRDPYLPSLPDLDRFNSATFDSTSVLRAAINSLFTNDRIHLPLDPLSVSFNNLLNYVYPAWGGDAQPRNSLYLRLDEPANSPSAVTGYCGASALTLWAVYRAFGYEVRKTDWVGGSINGQDFYYDASHVLTDVFMHNYQKYVMQDSTYNISGVVTIDNAIIPNSVLDLALVFSDAQYSPSVFSDGGYNYNVNPIKGWSVTYPGVDYRANFHMPASVVNAYSK